MGDCILPSEIVGMIFEFSCQEDLLVYREVCRSWRDEVDTRHLLEFDVTLKNLPSESYQLFLRETVSSDWSKVGFCLYETMVDLVFYYEGHDNLILVTFDIERQVNSVTYKRDYFFYPNFKKVLKTTLSLQSFNLRKFFGMKTAKFEGTDVRVFKTNSMIHYMSDYETGQYDVYSPWNNIQLEFLELILRDEDVTMYLLNNPGEQKSALYLRGEDTRDTRIYLLEQTMSDCFPSTYSLEDYYGDPWEFVESLVNLSFHTKLKLSPVQRALLSESNDIFAGIVFSQTNKYLRVDLEDIELLIPTGRTDNCESR